MSVVAWQGASSASAAEYAAVIEPQVQTFYVAHSERVAGNRQGVSSATHRGLLQRSKGKEAEGMAM